SHTGNATATDDCSGPVTITHSDTVTPGNCPGNYPTTRPCNSTDAGCNASTNCVQTITVSDTTPPTFTFCPASTNINCTASTNVSNTGNATATDDCSAPVTITHGDSVSPGTCPGNYTITRRFTATDSCGNANTN